MSVDLLTRALLTIPHEPGVYRMVDAQGKDLYIGKAKDLYKRVSSYRHTARLPHRLRQMISLLSEVRILVTGTELEALLLEANLIKRYKPPHNILLKEGNRFSYLTLTNHAFPKMHIQRVPSEKGACFGPFISASSLHHLSDLIHRIFLLRSCSDFVFQQRTRPCLQYHIKRCSAPCVGKITSLTYGQSVQDTMQFLQGKTQAITEDLKDRMLVFSAHHDYDKARIIRDQIQAIQQSHASLMSTSLRHGDIIALSFSHGTTSVHIVCLRHGSTYGAETFFFPHTTPGDAYEILTTFLMQFYEKTPPPRRIILNQALWDEGEIKILFRHKFSHSPHFIFPKRGDLFKLMSQAKAQGDCALERHLSLHHMQEHVWKEAASVLKLNKVPKRIEVYDNSHYQGDCAVSVMIVAGPEGWNKKAYRTFNMVGNDDYAMMQQVMKRRFDKDWPHPDLIVIDGGKGQLSAVCKALRTAKLSHLNVIGIAKSAPHDDILTKEGVSFGLNAHHPVVHLIQMLRDEAHRFAVQTHRRLKRKKALISPLRALAHIGPKRYQQLMNYFKTPQALEDASLEALMVLFSPKIAQKIHQSLQEKKTCVSASPHKYG